MSKDCGTSFDDEQYVATGENENKRFLSSISTARNLDASAAKAASMIVFRHTHHPHNIFFSAAHRFMQCLSKTSKNLYANQICYIANTFATIVSARRVFYSQTSSGACV